MGLFDILLGAGGKVELLNIYTYILYLLQGLQLSQVTLSSTALNNILSQISCEILVGEVLTVGSAALLQY